MSGTIVDGIGCPLVTFDFASSPQDLAASTALTLLLRYSHYGFGDSWNPCSDLKGILLAFIESDLNMNFRSLLTSTATMTLLHVISDSRIGPTVIEMQLALYPSEPCICHHVPRCTSRSSTHVACAPAASDVLRSRRQDCSRIRPWRWVRVAT
ncbi:hypothetical protein BD626DRAFT_205584 [Schizophyllum amplum]|uniref:Uncharacterized protein n=1 Tax=Schizophyllum amplum TaxID=97359 RepID=A0A550BZH9_9AGAR|nr:hypothetical protein BD626DRAFT_205584 [Auriculariopsis ampla]